MSVTMLPGLVVAVLLGGALLSAVLPAGARAVARTGLAAGLAGGVLAVWLAAAVWTGGPLSATWLRALPLGLPASLAVEVDALSALFLVLLAVVPCAALLLRPGLPGWPTDLRDPVPSC